MRSEALVPTNSGFVSRVTRQSDIAVALGVIGILFVMLVPMPALLLDLFLAMNITFSLVTLLIVLYVTKPLDFSVFPSMLLIATLFRLSLNVASTRRILLYGDQSEFAAGHVINSFGKFVVGGNYVVGFVVFLILVIIQFVVITKGAGRVAEVAARFTLDAMPMKQMSIDTDLSAGLITEEEARARRETVAREADFYGAMDGASKFVRGDAIAGLIITGINIIGGLLIGVLQKGMPISEAARRYTLLTIGDGLVSQVPALIISTAAGVLVTRAGAETDFGKSLTGQILFQPRALGIASAVLFTLALVPGLPKISFFMLSGITGSLAYLLMRTSPAQAEVEESEEKKSSPESEVEEVERMLDMDIMELNIGYNLVPLVDVRQDGVLLERIKMIRRRCARELGIIVPLIRIRDDMSLPPNGYSIIIKENVVARGEVMLNHYLAMETGRVTEKIEGIPTTEPTNNIPALWIREENKEKAQMAGYMVVDPVTVIATHLMETINKHAHELLTRQDVRRLLDRLSERYPALVDDLVPNLLSLGTVQKVLQNLLKERVPIRDLITILETLSDHAQTTKDPMLLTEFVRRSLGRTICKELVDEDGTLKVLTLSPEVERNIADAIQDRDGTMYLALDPDMAQRIVNGIASAITEMPHLQIQPVILCAEPLVRPFLRQLVERFIPGLAVLSYEEIPPEMEVKPLGVVNIEGTN